MTNYKTYIQTFCLLSVLLIMTYSCTYSVTLPKKPVYAISRDSLDKAIADIIVCESFSEQGEAIKENGKSFNKLKIEIMNPSSLSEMMDQRTVICKSIAQTFKRALADPDEFSIYEVTLTIRRNTKGTIGASKQSKSETREFNTKDLD